MPNKNIFKTRDLLPSRSNNGPVYQNALHYYLQQNAQHKFSTHTYKDKQLDEEMFSKCGNKQTHKHTMQFTTQVN